MSGVLAHIYIYIRTVCMRYMNIYATCKHLCLLSHVCSFANCNMCMKRCRQVGSVTDKTGISGQDKDRSTHTTCLRDGTKNTSHLLHTRCACNAQVQIFKSRSIAQKSDPEHSM